MGRGQSKIGGGSGGGMSQLNPLPSNVIGGKRKIFHDTMNSAKARGANNVRFTTGDMEDRVEYGQGWAVKGSYEIMAQNNGQDVIKRVSGEVTALNGRLYGVESDLSNYRVTDLRTGMLVTGNAQSKYAVWNSILTFNDGVSRNKSTLDNFEKRFANAHR